MVFDLHLAQHGATVTLNLALAVSIGAGMSILWLRRLNSPWAASQLSRLRRASLASLGIAFLASAAILWLEAATMAEVSITDAGAAAWSMATATHFGIAWTIGMAALVLSAGAISLNSHSKRATGTIWLSLFGLALFAYTRSMVSHAAADSDFNLAVFAESLHLILVCLWVGEVFVAGFSTLANSVGQRIDDRLDCARYIASLSASATFALIGILATGLFSAWHNLGSPDALVGNPYGTTLLVKLALVALAAFMGGFNRFFVMPKLVATLRDGDSASASASHRFTLILQAEASVLLGAMILAAILSSTSPPMV